MFSFPPTLSRLYIQKGVPPSFSRHFFVYRGGRLVQPKGLLPKGKWGLRACAGTCGTPIGALPRAEGGLLTPESRLAAVRASPCDHNDGLPVGRVTRTLAHTADHENNKRSGRHIWLQWTMIVGGEARPPSAHVWDRSPGFSAALRPTLQPA